MLLGVWVKLLHVKWDWQGRNTCKLIFLDWFCRCNLNMCVNEIKILLKQKLDYLTYILEIIYSSWPKCFWGNFFLWEEVSCLLISSHKLSPQYLIEFCLLRLLFLCAPQPALRKSVTVIILKWRSDHMTLLVGTLWWLPLPTPHIQNTVQSPSHGPQRPQQPGPYLPLQPDFPLCLSSLALMQPAPLTSLLVFDSGPCIFLLSSWCFLTSSRSCLNATFLESLPQLPHLKKSKEISSHYPSP